MSEFDIMKSALEKTGLYSVEEGGAVYAELMAYAEGLDMYFGALKELLRECFVGTAQGYGLALREKIFNRINLDTSLQGRRNALIKALSVNVWDYTLEGMEKVRDSFNAEGSFETDYNNMKVIFRCTQTLTAAQKTALQNQMKKFMPCWMDFEIP